MGSGISQSIGSVIIAVPTASPAGKELTRRLRETLGLLLEGKSEKEAASDLHLSHHTVHVYVKQLYTLFGVSSRSELIALVYRAIITRLMGRRRRIKRRSRIGAGAGTP